MRISDWSSDVCSSDLFPASHLGITVEDSLRSLQRIFQADVAATDVAAIIIEPVQGEGEFNPAPPGFLKALRGVADEDGIVLIAEGVQSGFARTCKLFAKFGRASCREGACQ